MTNEIEWGDVLLTGPQMKELRDAGMPENVMVRNKDGDQSRARSAYWSFSDTSPHYLLPANDPSYLCHVHNEENGTSFKPWYGGDEAPGDWDQGAVLLADGQSLCLVPHDWRAGNPYTIIGYHALPKQEEVAGEVPDLTARMVAWFERIKRCGGLFEQDADYCVTRNGKQSDDAELSEELRAILADMPKPRPTIDPIIDKLNTAIEQRFGWKNAGTHFREELASAGLKIVQSDA